MKLTLFFVALVACLAIREIWLGGFTGDDASVLGMILLLLGAAYVFARKEKQSRRTQANHQERGAGAALCIAALLALAALPSGSVAQEELPESIQDYYAGEYIKRFKAGQRDHIESIPGEVCLAGGSLLLNNTKVNAESYLFWFRWYRWSYSIGNEHGPGGFLLGASYSPWVFVFDPKGFYIRDGWYQFRGFCDIVFSKDWKPKFVIGPSLAPSMPLFRLWFLHIDIRPGYVPQDNDFRLALRAGLGTPETPD